MRTLETLEKLFGSAAKVKIVRLFLFNPKVVFDVDEISHRSKVSEEEARKELNLLQSIGLLSRRSVTKVVQVKIGRKMAERTKHLPAWKLNERFEMLVPLQTFLVQTMPVTKEDLAERFAKAGKLKLLVTSGVFNQYWDARVDLLIVGDNFRRASLENAVKSLESEVGKELTYSIFETEDFLYRIGMCDKLVRDILDYPHEKIVNKLDIA